MKRALFGFLTTFLLVGIISPAEVFGAYNGVITVDSIEVAESDPFALAITLSGSDMSFSGMRIPLKFDNSLLDIDSISFAGSIKPVDFQAAGDFSNFEGTVTITYLANFVNPLPTISTASGLLATVHGHVIPGATSGVKAVVDSINNLTSVGSGIFAWDRVEVTDNTGSGSEIPLFEAGGVVVGKSTSVEDKGDRVLPTEFALAQNYPNPFNPSTVIGFSIPKAGKVKLQIFNILGQTVRTLLDGPMAAGEYHIDFDANGLPSGIYFYRLTHASGTSTRKMALVK